MYRRSYYTTSSAKYSNETMCVNHQLKLDILPGDLMTDSPIIIVPATTVLGNRTVKNFTLKFNALHTDDSIIGILAYVPQGTTMSFPSFTETVQSLYEPNQNVIDTFIIPPTCRRDAQGVVLTEIASAPIVLSNTLSRDLNTGDSIQLALVTPNGLHAGDGQDGNEPACKPLGVTNAN